MEIQFVNPQVLLLLLLIPVVVVWYMRKHKSQSADIRFAHSFYIQNVRKSFRLRMMHLPFVLRIGALILVIIALARPQSAFREVTTESEGIDIVIAVDISGSMLAEDFAPNRMHAAKETALEFISMRPTDRIGITLFSGESFTLSPPTTDHASLAGLLEAVSTGMVEDGTAIGDGIATAINRLRNSQAVSRVIILLTDGINNAGVIDPRTSAEMARLLGIRIYTIGVGSEGLVPFPVETPFGIRREMVEMPIDDELLNSIAEETGGKYFWAGTMDKLRQIYREIDTMERTRTEITELEVRHDEFFPLLLLALALLILEFLLRNTWLKSNP